MRKPRRWRAALLFVVCVLIVSNTARAVASEPDGPPLRVPRAALDSALQCSGGLENASRRPVLLVHGTGLTPREFDWNYVPVLRGRGIPYCTVALPGQAMVDIQVSAEYVVHAIRTMHAESDRRVQIIGHSQGGMVPRWALRFWPETRGMVDDLVGLAPSNHGTVDAQVLCAPGCAPAVQQQKPGSDFLLALNSGQETYAGISYTNVYSRLDEVVVPNFPPRPSSALNTGDGEISNVATQQVCPLNAAEHLTTGTSDPVAHALTMDAITHPGPAEPARVSASACTTPFMPGVDPVTFPTRFADLAATVADQFATWPMVTEEPPLKPYATRAVG